MSGDHGDYHRDESEAQRLDRNYGELLQELRVAQTGVQFLFAFLLSIAFQRRFGELHEYERVIYLISLVSAGVAAVLLIAPVAMHRVLFRRHLKEEIVTYTSQLAAAGLTFLALAILSALLLVIDVVVNLGAAVAIAGVLGAVLLIFWWGLPLAKRRRDADRAPGAQSEHRH